MTMRYAHLAPAVLREAVGVLDEPRDLRQPDGNTAISGG
jgi:hypothetical protein